MATLPPGVSKADFAAALKKFESAIGKQWVFSSDDDVALYRDAYSPLWGTKDELLASAAVAPDTVEQVQAIVRIANEFRIPIYPISTGKNLGYGGSAPYLSGSVVVDLKRMNRVLEVDETRHFALVEPGVAYFDLYRHIQERKLPLWIDCPDPGWGSLIGNSLDHGVGYTWGPFRDHFGSHCGMEVVLANGEVLRTGMGAVPGSKTWQEYKYGFGPTVDGLFAQGNFGIVTKMGFWLMPEPEAYLAGLITVPRRKDLVPLVANVNYLEDTGLIGMPEYGSPLGGGIGGPPPDAALAALLDKRGGPSDAELDAYAASHGKGVWQVNLQFYGPAKTVQANWEYALARIQAAIPGAAGAVHEQYRFPMSDADKANLPHKVSMGIPNMGVFMIGARSPLNPTPQDGHMWFAAVVPRTGEAVFESQRVMTDIYKEHGIDVGSYLQAPATWHPRTFIMIVGFPISKSDPEISARSRAAFEHVVRVSAEHGWAEYRTPPALVEKVYSAYGNNNFVLRRFIEQMKDAVDPNGILGAGRGGIWPKHMRGKK
jgi:4-cresol dehydrogenase (hydroxylating)